MDNLESNSSSPSATATSSTTGHDDDQIETPTISSVVLVSITVLALVAILVLACVLHRYRQKKKLTRRIRMTENMINSIANDLKLTKAAMLAESQLHANAMIGQENQLQPLNAPPAALPPPPPCSHTPLSIGTSSVETYRCSPQSVITHSHEDDESSTSDEEYDMPTDADTSEKEISYTHNFHHEQRNTYSFFSTPQRGDARFLSLQTIATFQNLNDCTLETHYSTTLSTGFVHHSPPHHSSVPAFFSTSTTGTANTAVLMSDDVTNSPSAHYHPSSDDRHTVTVPENTPNNSQQHSYRLPNDSMCSKSTTLTMYTCPTSPIGSNTCIGDEDKGSDSDDEVFVEAADSEYQTDIEVWV